ncbi:MAG: MBL fold metallo-hydrolase [Candidatus Thorarchaeota archaeon]
MVIINSEGKINENTYLVDGQLFSLSGVLSIYIIEKDGMRIMIDTPQDIIARKFVKKLIEFDIHPVHKIVLTHSHFDHIQAVGKLKKLMKETEIEVLASENAIKNLKDPETYNKDFEMRVSPIEGVSPLKEGDIIDVNGLELEVLNFFGHSQDSIGLLDKVNKNIFVGDAIGMRWDPETPTAPIMPPDFDEIELLKTFDKLRNLKDKINSISFAHFGVYVDEDCDKIIDEMHELYLNFKNSIIKWYNENPSIDYIAPLYFDKFTPNSKIESRENPVILKMVLGWAMEGMKQSGFIS